MIPDASLDISRRHFLYRWRHDGRRGLPCSKTPDRPEQVASFRVRSRKLQLQRSRFKTFDAISVCFWVPVEISPF